MPIVNPANAADDVTEAPLGLVGRDAGAGHQRPGAAPQVVKTPAGHASYSVEFALIAAQRVGLTASPVGEQPLRFARHTFDDRAGSTAQGDQVIVRAL